MTSIDQREDPFDHSDIEPESAEVRRVKFVLFLGTIAVLLVAIVVMLVFFQPDAVPFVTRWPNGYPKTETEFVECSPVERPDGRIEQGRHRAWHENGKLAEEGHHERGERTGPWRFWDGSGVLDDERSGLYAGGVRSAPLGD